MAELYLYPEDVIDPVPSVFPIGTDAFDCINEPYDSPDDEASYIYSINDTNIWSLSNFELPNDPELLGATINSVTLYIRGMWFVLPDTYFGFLSINGTKYFTNEFSNALYKTNEKTWVKNPSNDSPWQQSDIDNLIIGTKQRWLSGGNLTHVTQLYIKVDYEVPTSEALSTARIGDIGKGICTGHSSPISMTGVIMTGALISKVEGIPVARVGDIVKGACGHIGIISTGSSKSNTEGPATARVTDEFTGVFSGTIITGASKSFTGG